MKLEAADEWRARNDRQMEKLVDAMDRLTRIEMHNSAQTEAMTKLQQDFSSFKKSVDDRLTAIEREMPTVTQARDGGFHIAKLIAAAVLAGVIGSVSTLMTQRAAPAAPPTHQPTISAPHATE